LIGSINVLLVSWWSSTVSPHLPHPPRPYFGVAAACSFTRRSSRSFFMRGCLARERARRCSRCTRAWRAREARTPVPLREPPAGGDGAPRAGAAAADAPDAPSRRVRAAQQVARGDHAGGSRQGRAAVRPTQGSLGPGSRDRPAPPKRQRGGPDRARCRAGRINPAGGLIGAVLQAGVDTRRAVAQWTSAVRHRP
jgi:hypothetical protein